MPVATDRERLLRLAQRQETLTTKEVSRAGIHSQQLTRLVTDGRLVRIARGLYRQSDRSTTEHHGLAVAAQAVPQGVICLLSALGFHGVGTELPHEVWIALDRRTRRPALAWPPLRIVRFGGQSLTAGVELHRIEGQNARIFGVAKTLADCFKYRNKIGLDVALQALREAWRARRVTMQEIDRFARICRVGRVMRPYLEALVV
jgi:predicted transcriptional regulator of viral defense system